MPSTPTERFSLEIDLESRYKNQRVGSAFDVKQTLGNPGDSPQPGDRMPVDGNEMFYSVDNFAVKKTIGMTEFLDALEANSSDSAQSKQISLYMKGFSSQKYKP